VLLQQLPPREAAALILVLIERGLPGHCRRKRQSGGQDATRDERLIK
jgi:hypothetical protein